MKIYLDTVGCRLNQSEIEAYARQFLAAGHSLVPSPEQADWVVVNTCTVTNQAAADSRQKIRQASHSGEAQIIATGCWATLNPDEAAALPGVKNVISNFIKDNLVADLLQVSPEMANTVHQARQPIPGSRWRTRAFIKAQDGCDNHCTYCITRIARGRGRSRMVPEILADIQAALSGGAKEIVLTGVHLASWGHDFQPPSRLNKLVKIILDDTSTPRLHLSSLEPWDLDIDFFTLWENPRLNRHLHIPLQSGCAHTLKRMARKITPENYAAMISTARKAIPGVAITTDIIAGFPGEDENEFNDSLAFVRQMNFAGGHVFTYSARPGTPAASLPEQVPHPVRKRRSAQLRTIFDKGNLAYRQSYVGRVVPVLWESAVLDKTRTWKLNGLSDNYLRVSAENTVNLWNQITSAQLTSLNEHGLCSEIILPPTPFFYSVHARLNSYKKSIIFHMITKSHLESALKDAMRAGDEVGKRTIRMALSAIRLVEIDKGAPLDEPGLLAVLQKEVKSRNEAIADAQRANRADLVAASQAEIAVLETFLPKPLTPEELETLARQAIAEVGASSAADMGKVMKILNPRLQGRATGAQASQVVRQLIG